MSDTVNTGFILDMQRKLYRWSAADPDKGVRGSVQFGMRSQNAHPRLGKGWPATQGSHTPGTDGVTRKKVEERPGGVAGFLEEIRARPATWNLPAPTCSAKADPEAGQTGKVPPVGHSDAQRPTGANGAQNGAGADLRGGVLSNLVWLPARTKHPRCAGEHPATPAPDIGTVPRGPAT